MKGPVRRPARRTTATVGALVLLLGNLGPSVTSVALATDQETVASTFTTDTLDPPTNLQCTAGLTSCSQAFLTKPTLTWTATLDTYATGYRVLRSTTNGSGYVQIATVTGRTTTTFTDNGVSAATTYYYVVQSVAAVWTSVNSNQVTVVVLL
jgi:hypothetical protein